MLVVRIAKRPQSAWLDVMRRRRRATLPARRSSAVLRCCRCASPATCDRWRDDVAPAIRRLAHYSAVSMMIQASMTTTMMNRYCFEVELELITTR